jgi:hypothetical protein
MKKVALWAIALAIGLLIGLYGYDRYQRYQMERAVERTLEQFFADIKEIMVDQDTVCTVDADTGECGCILQSTGAVIDKPGEECVARATEALADLQE